MYMLKLHIFNEHDQTFTQYLLKTQNAIWWLSKQQHLTMPYIHLFLFNL